MSISAKKLIRLNRHFAKSEAAFLLVICNFYQINEIHFIFIKKRANRKFKSFIPLITKDSYFTKLVYSTILIKIKVITTVIKSNSNNNVKCEKPYTYCNSIFLLFVQSEHLRWYKEFPIVNLHLFQVHI